MKIRLQIAALLAVVGGMAVGGAWAAFHFDQFGYLLLLLPAFALLLA